MAKILLSGVPGTGKSTVAKHVETHYGFFHVDMEENDFAPRHEFEQDREQFLGKLAAYDNILISWGFGPFQDRASVKYLQEQGFSLVWLDGNRVASFREFMKRENNDPVKEAAYYGQMQMIVVTDIVDTLKPTIINPFTANDQFKSVDAIAQEIISAPGDTANESSIGQG